MKKEQCEAQAEDIVKGIYGWVQHVFDVVQRNAQDRVGKLVAALPNLHGACGSTVTADVPPKPWPEMICGNSRYVTDKGRRAFCMSGFRASAILFATLNFRTQNLQQTQHDHI